MRENITVFKIKIINVRKDRIVFDLFSGERVDDTFVNTVSTYRPGGALILTPKQFSDFSQRLIAYVHISKLPLTEEVVKILWELRLNIWDHESQKLSKSIFQKKAVKDKLFKLGLVKEDKNK